MNWDEIKKEAEGLLRSNPQRGALASHAIKQVEAGLQALALVGLHFDHQPRAESSLPRSHTIDDAISHVRGQQPSMVVSGGSEIFEERADAE